VSAALLSVVCGLGIAHLVAYYAGQRVVAGVLKSLPILILAAVVWQRVLQADDGAISFANLVGMGLIFSAVGDVSLVFERGFLPGLSAFFAAHCCYIAAFLPGVVVSGASAIAAVAIVVAAGSMLRRLWPHVARVRVPVVVYVGALGFMTWCAIARATAPGAAFPACAGAVGALSFLVSDSVLAYDRFARRFAGAHAVVMVTYYAAQILIARAAL
jgi:uncharacterized membrane protein YhhN